MSSAPYSASLPGGPVRPRTSVGAAICRTICCAQTQADEERLSIERQKWKAKWGDVVRFVRQIASGRGQRKKSPRDLLFEALLTLYAHDENMDEAIRSLYDIWEVAPHVVTHFVPQLVNFLLHGRMPGAERLEIFLLDKCERSMHFAQRMFFFIQAYAPNVPYSSELCGAIQNKGLLLAGRSPLIRAVQVQGGLAATRMAKQAFYAQHHSHHPSPSAGPSVALQRPSVYYPAGVSSSASHAGMGGAAALGRGSGAAAITNQGHVSAASRKARKTAAGAGLSGSSLSSEHAHKGHGSPQHGGLAGPAMHDHDQANLEERAAVALVAFTPWALNRAIPSEPLPPRAIDMIGGGGGHKRPSHEPSPAAGAGAGVSVSPSSVAVSVAAAPASAVTGKTSKGTVILVPETSPSPAAASGFVSVSIGGDDEKASPAAPGVAAAAALTSEVGLNTALAQRIKQNLATHSGPAPLPHPYPPGAHQALIQQPGTPVATAGGGGAGSASDGAQLQVSPNPLHASSSSSSATKPRSRSGSVAASMAAAAAASATASASTEAGAGAGAGGASTINNPLQLHPIQHKPELIREPSSSAVPVVGGSSAFCGSAASAIGCAGGPGAEGSSSSILSAASFGLAGRDSRALSGAGGALAGDGASSVAESILAVANPPVGGVESHDGFLSAFNDTPAICSELTRIGYQLIPAPVEQRNALLRLALQAVAARFLPSYTAYIPVGNPFNRLVAIHPDHSFCFKTKERVPFMLVLECVDYANSSGGPLDEVDEDADDEQLERAKRLKAARLYEQQVAAAAAAREAKEAKRRERERDRHHHEHGASTGGSAGEEGDASGTDGEDSEGGTRRRGRSSTLGGGAADAAEKMAAAVSEGVRSAAEMVSGGAHAISNYFQRQFAEVSQRRLRTRRQQGQGEALTEGERGRGRDRASRNSTRKVRGGSFDNSGSGLGGGITSLASELRAESANPDARRSNIRKARATYAPGADHGRGPLQSSLSSDGLLKQDSLLSTPSTAEAAAAAGVSASGLEMSPQPKKGRIPSLMHQGSASFSGVIGDFSAGSGDARTRSFSAHSDSSAQDYDQHPPFVSTATHSASSSWRSLGGSASDTVVEKERERSKRGLLAGAASAVSAERIGASFSKGKAVVQDAIAALRNNGPGGSSSSSNSASLRKPLIPGDEEDAGKRGRGESHSSTEDGRPHRAHDAIAPISAALGGAGGDGSSGGSGGGDVTARLSALGQWGGPGPVLLVTPSATPVGLPPAEALVSPGMPMAPATAASGTLEINGVPVHHSASANSLFSPVVDDVAAASPSLPAGTKAPGLATAMQTTASAASSVSAARFSAAGGGQVVLSPGHTGLVSPAGFALASPQGGSGGAGSSIFPPATPTPTPTPTPGAAGAASAHHHQHHHREALTADADLDRELRDLPADIMELVQRKMDPDAPDDDEHATQHPGQRSTGASGSSSAPGVSSLVSASGAGGAGGDRSAAVVSKAFAAIGSGTLRSPADDAASTVSEGAASASSASAGAGTARTAPTIVFAERWREKEARIAAASPYSHLPGWRLMPVIVKAHDDLRQEQFAGQLMQQFFRIFRAASVPVWMRPYDILATQADGGILACVPDTISVDALKRGDPHFTTLDDWFERHFNWGPRGAERVAAARLNFVRSMAGYSIVCYILAIKDRHNGNILIDRKGHVIHIDFGFLFTNSPGGNINFEAAPFKLTQEFVQVMGGPRSSLFSTFRKLCVQAFLAARKYRERILLLVEMMLSGNADLKCFIGGPKAVISGLRARFHEDKSDRQCAKIVNDLIDASNDALRTRLYDAFQRWSQGVR